MVNATKFCCQNGTIKIETWFEPEDDTLTMNEKNLQKAIPGLLFTKITDSGKGIT